MGVTMKVIVEARRLSREARDLLIGNAIKKAVNGEIVVLTDDDNAREDISYAARNHGWMLKGIESQGDSYRITITPAIRRHSPST
jgi:TusA-related sulfurtransferase